MKAAWYERNGEARDVLVVGEMATPTPQPGEVLVHLATSGVNPSDVKSRRGRPLVAPRIVPHSDGAGVIEEVGDGVDGARIGERVWIWNGQWQRPFGTAAQYIDVPEAQAVRLPDAVDFAIGACLGIPALTAFQAVEHQGDVAGKTLLVTGAAASVGHYVTQIAARRGARVIGTASAARREAALSAGAEMVIDYRAEGLADRILEATGGKGVDGIIDMDLSSTAPLLSKGVLAPHGKLVCYGSNAPGETPVSFPAMLWGSLTLQLFLVYDLTTEQRGRAVEGLTALLEGNALAHIIGATFTLDEIAAAHEAVEGGRIIGNVVVTTD